MSEKVKVTQAQSEWLDRYKNDEEIAYAIDLQPLKKRPDSPLVDWSASKVAKALYIGYEVEETFKVGDWKKYKHALRKVWVYGVVSHVSVRAVDLDTGEGVHIISMDRLESCTPEEIKAEKERRLWKSIGREVGEFKELDTGFDFDGRIVPGFTALNEVYKNGTLKGFYPAESFISFGGGEE